MFKELKVGVTGLELSNVTACHSKRLTKATQASAAKSGALGATPRKCPSDLQIVIDVWASLPVAAQAAIATLAAAAATQPGQ